MGGWVHKLSPFVEDVLCLLCNDGLLHNIRGVAAFLEFFVILPVVEGREPLLLALSLPLTSKDWVLDKVFTVTFLSCLSLAGILTN